MLHIDLKNEDYCNWKKLLNYREESDDPIQKDSYIKTHLQILLNTAYNQTKGYKKLYDNIPNINEISDFEKLPFTNKELLRKNVKNYTIPKYIKANNYITTGGSTGEPFGFYRSKKAFKRELASKAFLYSRIGWTESDRQIVLRGMVLNGVHKTEFFPEYNEFKFSSYHLTPERIDYYYHKILDYKPRWLKCYPSAGYIFAKFLKENNYKLRFNSKWKGLNGILCASENLHDYQKKMLEEIFKCRVFSHYGHYESAVLAGYCEHSDTYHVLPYYGYCELVDQHGIKINKIGEIGEIVATSFIMDATLFIRYKTGDLAVYGGEKCDKCGRHNKILTRIEGRLQEFLVTKDNRKISMTALNMHNKTFDKIKQYQFYQEEPGLVEFRYIRANGPVKIKGADKLDIKYKLLEKFDSDMSNETMEIRMHEVDNIQPTKRGKQKVIIQKLELNNG